LKKEDNDMARIKIKDLPKGKEINQKDMRRIFGGPNRRLEVYDGPFSNISGIETTDIVIDPVNPNIDYNK
jgi:hypothetical protein